MKTEVQIKRGSRERDSPLHKLAHQKKTDRISKALSNTPRPALTLPVSFCKMRPLTASTANPSLTIK